MVDPREGRPLFLDQTEACRGEKKFLRTGNPLISGNGCSPLPSSQVLDPALVMSVTGRESPLFSYANPVVTKIILFYSIGKICKLKGKIHAL